MRDESKAFFYIDKQQQTNKQTKTTIKNKQHHTHVKTYKWMIQILRISKAYYLTQEATIVWLQLQTWEHDCYSSL